MPWYYANNNHRLGPVSDTEFARLAREKVIIDDTLVWRHGMPDWKTYAEIVPTLPVPEITALPVGMEEPIATESATAVPVVIPQATARLRYAGFWVRLLAKLVDWIVLLMVSRLLAYSMGLQDVNPFEMVDGDVATLAPLVERMLLLGLLDGLARLVYYWYFLRRFAATPGKILLRLRVVNADGGKLTDRQIIGRFFSEVLNKYFTLCIGYVVAAFDVEKRAMHDHFSGTRVVQKEDR